MILTIASLFEVFNFFHKKTCRFDDDILNLVSLTALYFANMIKALEDLGYTKDLNIRGLSYDWRKALCK